VEQASENPSGMAASPVGKASTAYMPVLDGFRAISIALVVVSHSGLREVVPGLLGVLIFFVISGFLITRQMIVEVERTGTLDLRGFYLRRIFRLAPALLAYLALFWAVLTALGSVITPTHILSGIFYFANFYEIFHGFTPHNHLPIIWSLSVEEHFYIVFPFLMLAFRRDLKRILPLLLGIVVAVLGWRLYLFGHCVSAAGWITEGVCGRTRHVRIHGTDILFDSILFGAITALVLHYHNGFARRWIIRRGAFACAALVLLGTLAYREPMFRDTVRFSIQAMAIGVLLVNALFQPGLERVRRELSRPLVLLVGRMSYSIYLFHFGVANTLYAVLDTEHSLSNPAAVAVYFVASWLLALASYRWIEQPMVRFRKRFGSHAKAESVPAADAVPEGAKP
jgi:peptidoglycan/LPS O-acetylase OafA/YrhL